MDTAIEVTEPFRTFVLLTLFLLYVMLAGSVSVMSFLPAKSAESEALRRVSLVVAILLMYNYGLRLWSMLPADMVWMAWVFFSTITLGSLAIAVLYWKYGLRDSQQKPTIEAFKDLKAPLLKTAAVPAVAATP